MAFPTARLSRLCPAASERLTYTPDARAPTHNTPEWTPPETSSVEGGLRHSTPSPHHRARPPSGAAPAGDDALESVADSPGAGRFSVPAVRSAPHPHGAAYGPRRRPHRSHPRLRGVQAAQLPYQQEQAQQPRPHHAAQVLQVVPLAHEPPRDALAAEERSWRATASGPSSARRAARPRTPARPRPSRTGRTSPASWITARATRTSSRPASSRARAASRSTPT